MTCERARRRGGCSASRLVFALAVVSGGLLLEACGARSELEIGAELDVSPRPPDSELERDGGLSPPFDATPRCEADRRVGAILTRSGPCEGRGLECGAECGRCVGDETCVGGRCYSQIGAGPVSPLSGDRVLLTLADRALGERHDIRRVGTLERVEVSLWSNGDLGRARLDVYHRCGDTDVLLRTTRIEASDLGRYSGVRSPAEPSIFVLDEPVLLADGDVFDVVLSPEGSDPLVLGVHTGRDIYPEGRAISQLALEVADVFEELTEVDDAAVTLLVHDEP